MNKKALKDFAVNARVELLQQVAAQALRFGVTEENVGKLEIGTDHILINGKTYDKTLERPYRALTSEWKRKGYEQVIEEVAYTWFNRLIALRFIEIHRYLPSGIRMLSSETGKAEPDILVHFRESGLSVDVTKVESLLAEGTLEKREEAYRLLLLAQCNELSEIMPFLFENSNDYTELLLPDMLLHIDSVIHKMIDKIAEEDFQQVEVIGWLYQYYISEKQREIVGMNKGTVSKEELPAATQLFTPKWIVQYMVQNSLGKMWNEINPNSDLPKQWEYYLKHEKSSLPPGTMMELEEVKFIDPACGSGHILVYAFDMLYDMYASRGYASSDIPLLILQKNLYGLDIDKRAVQMTSFALMMKAREKSRRFFRKAKELKLNVAEFIDARFPSEDSINLLCMTSQQKEEIKEVISAFSNAKQFGSLSISPKVDYVGYISKIEDLVKHGGNLTEQMYAGELKQELLPVLQQADWLKSKYDIVVTNPPYHNKYNSNLKEFLVNNYKDYKADLYSSFIYRCTQMTKQYGYIGLMTPFTWMFLSSYEKLRKNIINHQSISSLIQLEYSSFKEATVPICTFVIQNQSKETIGQYIRLTTFKGEDIQPIKVKEAVYKDKVWYRYCFNGKHFEKIKGSPLAYWRSKKIDDVFNENPNIGNKFLVKKGLSTGDNPRFLRYWFEVKLNSINLCAKTRDEFMNSVKVYAPYTKGGNFRRWYGNFEYIIAYNNYHLNEMRKLKGHRHDGKEFYFKRSLTWSAVTSGKFSMRYVSNGFVFDQKGPICTTMFEHDNLLSLLAYMNTKVAQYILDIITPTLDYSQGPLSLVPYIVSQSASTNQEIQTIAERNINLSKNDWDSFESSWDFQQHPFLIHRNGNKLAEVYDNWKVHTEQQFYELQQNEEKLNRIFIDLYGLQDELIPEVPDEEVTVRQAHQLREVKSFLSYFVGCVMGRYSLDIPGLAYAGGEWDATKYQVFLPDANGILPLTDQIYFEDDIIARLEQFLKAIFGLETLQENLHWLAEALEMKQNETPLERLRRYFFDEFYQDHVQTYQKRPIYWMIESGKKKGFRALVYLHRYSLETLAGVRVNYLHNLQTKYTHEEKVLNDRLTNPSLSRQEKTAAQKRIKLLRERQEELVEFDKRLASLANQRITLDLDNGVVANYAKLQDVLAKIK
ncbi:N-6 DNA methylase [Aneurinibacillus soli]|uniref:site-specific DNA-methyltransferase (adenine-specific) n=1 Tax=Aneurinibacillus soli TaxID=1500254 RepID=A0A0U4WNA6_9BACL|nr:BREX-1 system adenine-specific DNA-methyltransferase PglX [Aneurinibacillus soli]PYE61919.1 N-6 DNA methylase [Aneurinibacillus soli]BAU29736.1 Type IIS restriction enzyme Eco57I [Aneurinibacillus soli]